MARELRSAIVKFYKIKYFHDFTNYVVNIEEVRNAFCSPNKLRTSLIDVYGREINIYGFYNSKSLKRTTFTKLSHNCSAVFNCFAVHSTV